MEVCALLRDSEYMGIACSNKMERSGFWCAQNPLLSILFKLRLYKRSIIE